MKKVVYISVVLIFISTLFSCSFGLRHKIPESGYWSTDDGTLTFEITENGLFAGTFKTEDRIVEGLWNNKPRSDLLLFCDTSKAVLADIMQVRLVSFKEDKMIFKVINYPEKLKGKKFVLIKRQDKEAL